MMITVDQLARCCGSTLERAHAWHAALVQALEVYDISTAQRQAGFLAQVGHESMRLKCSTELWGPTPDQVRYERDPAAPWSLRLPNGDKHRNSKPFELGNSQRGDGSRFRGHGLIQTTGRRNHAEARDQLRRKFPGLSVPDFEAQPEQLALTPWAALSAGQFWDSRGLNALADVEAFVQMTKRINGGTNGIDDRMALYEGAKRALGVR